VEPSECQAVGQRWLTPGELLVRDRLITQWTGWPYLSEGR
jgi:hypothetical protein